MTTKEFANKYGWTSRLKKGYRGILEKVDNRDECLSDLNALIRDELIKFKDYVNDTFCEGNISNILDTEDIDEYLKSQQ